MSAWQAQNHKRQHKLLATASRTDPLTGCLNRRGFEECADAQIQAMQRQRPKRRRVVLDIDHFKPVNDTFGHAAGDELLCWVAQTLERVVRPTDAVGRLGGDEFAVILPELERGAGTRDRRAHRRGAARARSGLLWAGDLPRRRRQPRVPLPPCRCSALRLARGTQHDRELRRGDRAARTPPAGGAQRCPRVDPATAETPETPSSKTPANLWRATLDAIPSRLREFAAHDDAADRPAELYDQIDASVICTDMQGSVIGWNSGAEALYGWTAEEAIGRSAQELIVAPEDTRAGRTAGRAGQRRRALGRRAARAPQGRLAVHRLCAQPSDPRRATASRPRSSAWQSTSPHASPPSTSSPSRATMPRQSQNAWARACSRPTCDGHVTYVNRAARSMLGALDDGDIFGELVHTAARGRLARARSPTAPIARALAARAPCASTTTCCASATAASCPSATPLRPTTPRTACRAASSSSRTSPSASAASASSSATSETLATINRVEEAILDDRFVLYAQPIVDLRSREAVQHELLLRMREPDGAIVAPGEFLPVAEQYALIGEIDWWVIKRATQLAGEGCPVQLNVSARSVCDPDVLEHIERSIEQCEVAPGLLVFEITETAIVEDEQAARTFAERVQALGCKVALDDFGTGYGSLTYLKQIPVDFLKIDIEFVRDLARNSASRHVVQALVALAKDFGVQTVGEGVEDAETLELLAELGVDYAQGFHIARPEYFAERPGDQSAPVEIQARAVERKRPAQRAQLAPRRARRQPRLAPPPPRRSPPRSGTEPGHVGESVGAILRARCCA